MDKSKHSSPLQKEKPPVNLRFNALESAKCLIRQAKEITFTINGLFITVLFGGPQIIF